MSGNERLKELTHRLHRWLHDPASTDSIASELLLLAPAEWVSFVAQFPDPERGRIAQTLTGRAYTLQSTSAAEAVIVSHLAVYFAKSHRGTNPGEGDALLIEGDAWREHARSLLLAADYDEAEIAANEAAFIYAILLSDGAPPASFQLHGHVLAQFLTTGLLSGAQIPDSKREVMLNAASLEIIRGETLHNQGKTDEGLVLIERACEVYLHLLNRKDNYVQGRTIYAKVLGEALRWKEAAHVFNETAAMAAETDDREVQAFLLGNIGTCYYYLGNRAKAKECAETAMQMFEELELYVDAVRPRTLLVLVLMEEGERNPARYNRAAAELYKTRAAWLEAGRKNEAARIMVRIIRALILAGRPQTINWAEMNRTFGGVHLGHAAMRALQHLEEIAAQRALVPSDADAAEEIIANLTPSGEEFEKAG